MLLNTATDMKVKLVNKRSKWQAIFETLSISASRKTVKQKTTRAPQRTGWRCVCVCVCASASAKTGSNAKRLCWAALIGRQICTVLSRKRRDLKVTETQDYPNLTLEQKQSPCGQLPRTKAAVIFSRTRSFHVQRWLHSNDCFEWCFRSALKPNPTAYRVKVEGIDFDWKNMKMQLTSGRAKVKKKIKSATRENWKMFTRQVRVSNDRMHVKGLEIGLFPKSLPKRYNEVKWKRFGVENAQKKVFKLFWYWKDWAQSLDGIRRRSELTRENGLGWRRHDKALVPRRHSRR